MILVRFPTLLVVDDDPTIIRSLQMNLEADGFRTMAAATAQEALTQVEHQLPDMAIVDLILPDMHGFELSKKLKEYVDIPIIMLTAVSSEESIVRGLELYAEDYIVKPFSYRELLARVQRVLRRTRNQAVPPETVTVVDPRLSLDFARHRVLRDRQEIHLTPIESRLLAALARNLNRTVTSGRLMDEAWPDGEGDVGRLWVNIRRLRTKLEDDPDHPQRLLTQRGGGYKLRSQDDPPG
ncbi:MAG: response regulator transcription factor [Chloroflexi bacterium]|nr:response regulator transcription factor [Chloroflexota bacterium]